MSANDRQRYEAMAHPAPEPSTPAETDRQFVTPVVIEITHRMGAHNVS